MSPPRSCGLWPTSPTGWWRSWTRTPPDRPIAGLPGSEGVLRLSWASKPRAVSGQAGTGSSTGAVPRKDRDRPVRLCSCWPGVGWAARAHGCPGQQRRCPSRSAVGAITFEQWRVVFGLNGDGMFHTAKAFVPGMGERGWGRIVNTTPNSVSLVAPRYRHCVAGKMAVIGLPPPALATELAGRHRSWPAGRLSPLAASGRTRRRSARPAQQPASALPRHHQERHLAPHPNRRPSPSAD
ncbi:SDR family NAD(P)-dependent oxidoreductase [Streptomyces europaeiscabiei]